MRLLVRALAAVLLVGSVLVAGPAGAHASLLGTDPEEGAVLATAPSRATFTFDEPVRSAPGGVHLFNAAGKELPATGRTADTRLVVDLPDGLDEGTYVVAWRVVSSDGHPVAGALTFSVGQPSARVVSPQSVVSATPRTTEVAVAVAQAWVYLSVFLATGLVAFLVLVLPRVPGLDETRRRVRRIAGTAAVSAGVASYVLLVLSELYRSGQGFGALTDLGIWVPDPALLETWAAIALVAATAGAVGLVVRAPRPALALGGVGLASLALVGHTRAFGPAWLVVASDVVHVCAGAVWFGGLVGLAVSLRRLADRPRTAAETLSGFSTLAAGLLTVVALTGTILGWRILGSWSALWETDFGITLLVKLGFVALVVALAAHNRFRLLPAVASDEGHAGRVRAAGRLRTAVRLEAVLLVCVLATTGVLVDRSPVPGEASAAGVPGGLDRWTHVGQARGLRVVLRLTPGRVGANDVTVQVQDTAQNPVEPYAVPSLSFQRGAVDLGDLALTVVDSGTYTASVVLPQAGRWTAQVTVRTGEFDSQVVPVRFAVTPAAR